MYKKLLLMPVILLSACSNVTYTEGKWDLSNDFKTVMIDGCEYLYQRKSIDYGLLALKANGNCGCMGYK